jgi:hypothetical protein
MTAIPHQTAAQGVSLGDGATLVLAQRLAAAGLGVQVSRHRDTCQLTILHVAGGKSFVALGASGHARWYYEPAAGPNASPGALTEIIGYLLGAPQGTASLAAYRSLPLKGQVGRAVQDPGLTVGRRGCEDWESFEATTDIEITSPARPWLGTVRLSDDAAVDWCLNWREAFRDNSAALIDIITPILRHH